MDTHIQQECSPKRPTTTLDRRLGVQSIFARLALALVHYHTTELDVISQSKDDSNSSANGIPRLRRLANGIVPETHDDTALGQLQGKSVRAMFHGISSCAGVPLHIPQPV